MEIRKQKGKQVGRLIVTEQIDQKHQEDLQRLRGFRLLDDDLILGFRRVESEGMGDAYEDDTGSSGGHL